MKKNQHQSNNIDADIIYKTKQLKCDFYELRNHFGILILSF